MTPKEELIRAREIIAENGAVATGAYYNRSNGCACMAGAVILAKGYEPNMGEGAYFGDEANQMVLSMEDPAIVALASVIDSDLEYGPYGIFHFNDGNHRNIDAILAKFDEAIASLGA